MKKEVLEIILKSFNEKKNSHAFLLETDDLDLALEDILDLIKKINFNILENKEFNQELFSDIKIVRPDGKEIKKEQIKEVMTDFQTFPFILQHKYYIIVSSELMNQSSANVLLKFLEEPDNQVVGFFLTMNKQAMINTIVSRCQNFKLTYNNEAKDLEDSKDFIDSMDTAKFERIIFLNSWFTKDRVQNMNQLRQVRDFLLDKVSHLENLKINLKRIDLLEEGIRSLGKNANQDLVILDLVRKW